MSKYDEYLITIFHYVATGEAVDTSDILLHVFRESNGVSSSLNISYLLNNIGDVEDWLKLTMSEMTKVLAIELRKFGQEEKRLSYA